MFHVKHKNKNSKKSKKNITKEIARNIIQK